MRSIRLLWERTSAYRDWRSILMHDVGGEKRRQGRRVLESKQDKHALTLSTSFLVCTLPSLSLSRTVHIFLSLSIAIYFAFHYGASRL